MEVATPAIVAAITLLGNKVAESVASETGKAAYKWIQECLGLAHDAAPAEVAAALPAKVDAQPALAQEIAERLAATGDEDIRKALASSGQLVGTIKDSKGVNIAHRIENVTQTFN